MKFIVNGTAVGLVAAALSGLFLTGPPGASAAEASNAVLDIDQAVQTALANNPGWAATRAQALATAEIPEQAGALPDPWLTAEPGRADMSQLKIGITQALPYPGKRNLARQAAEYRAEAAGFEATEGALVLTAQVKQVWWRLFTIDRALEIHHRNLDVMRRLIRVAETRYRVGQGLQQDVLLAQLELSKLFEEEIGLDGERRVAVAKLNALLDRSPATPVSLPVQTNENLPLVAQEQTLIDRALATRPLLAAQQRQVDAAAAQADLARKDYRPDFMVGANYEWRDGSTDMKSAMFAMSLPLRPGSRQDRVVSQRNAELLMQRYGLQDLEARLAADVAAARADYERAREQVGLVKNGVLPQASLMVASMLAGYQVGKVDFLNLAGAQITVFEYEIRYWRALGDAWTALAQLIATVGEEQVYE